MNVCFPAKADIRLLTLIYCFRPKADTLINQILQINVMVDQNNEPSEIELISFLFSALKEAQDSIRAFDVKAQIVGIGYIFATGIIAAIGSLLIGVTYSMVNFNDTNRILRRSAIPIQKNGT